MSEEYVTELKMDLSREGLGLFFQDWQVKVLEHVHAAKETGSKAAWDIVRPERSRAAVINFLNWMVDEGLLECYETFGKGGMRRIYHLPAGADLGALKGELMLRSLRKLSTLGPLDLAAHVVLKELSVSEEV